MSKLLLLSLLLIATSLSATTPTQENVTKLYVATFNRAPDTAGLDYWVNSGLELEDIASSFFDQEETKTLYPSGTSNRDFISSVYINLFNRFPDTAGWDYWENQLNAGSITKNRFIEAVINGAQDDATSNDATILSNKATVGLKFANAGLNDALQAKDVMSIVSDNVATIASAESTILLASGYQVKVERGAVFDANVTDANGSVATQVSDTNNTYVFTSEPVYPITAVGGWIDVNGDGNLTEADIPLDINLTSYSDNITPTTTYIADENETIRDERLEELANETNTTAEDLLEVPSEATKHSIIVLNAVYEKLIERHNNRSSAPLAIQAILDKYLEIENNTNVDENATSKEIAQEIEDQTIFILVGKGLVKKLDLDDILEINIKKPKRIKDHDREESLEKEKKDREESLEKEKKENERALEKEKKEREKASKKDDEEDDDKDDHDENDNDDDSSVSDSPVVDVISTDNNTTTVTTDSNTTSAATDGNTTTVL